MLGLRGEPPTKLRMPMLRSPALEWERTKKRTTPDWKLAAHQRKIAATILPPPWNWPDATAAANDATEAKHYSADSSDRKMGAGRKTAKP